MSAGTMRIGRRTLRSFLNENKMPRILFSPVHIISKTQGLFLYRRDELAAQSESAVLVKASAITFTLFNKFRSTLFHD